MSPSDEADELIRGSGNTFNAKVARWFSENGWHVVVSPYYLDQGQNKAREIDLLAENLWPVRNLFGHEVDDVAVRLFIECKFVSSTSVFWFAEKDQELARELVCTGGIFQASNTYTDKHHYLSQGPRVAKLFSINTGKALENDPFYKALNQALTAMISMRGKPVSVHSVNKSRRNLIAVIEFPLVVCSSFEQFYSVDFYADSKPEPIKDNFQLEVRYAYIDRNQSRHDEYFLLDFVEFNRLAGFVEAIDEDAKVAAFLVAPN